MKPIYYKRHFNIAFLFIIAILPWLNQDAQAQQASGNIHPPHWSAQKKAQKLSDKQARMLHLTQQQAQQIENINNDIAGKMDQLRAYGNQDKKARMEKMKALHEERNNRYKTVLNATQYQSWNDWAMKQHEKMKVYRKNQRKKILNG